MIAGPIVHHGELIPQFIQEKIYKFNARNFSIGLTIFIFGLFKKVIIADTIAKFSTPVFGMAEAGTTLTFFEAWGGALAYTFQLYFDFSGYSDMAIGLAFMIGVKLPINFLSPYQSGSIIDFWSRWHMSLSRFLRDYLYIPLGGSRLGKTRRYFNLFITMLLGGLWHGAAWTFVFWGGLHGIYLMINHAWRSFRSRNEAKPARDFFLASTASRAATFAAVVVAWVAFRSNSFAAMKSMWGSMFGLNGISLPQSLSHSLGRLPLPFINKVFVFNGAFHNGTGDWTRGVPLIILLLFLVWFSPNIYQLMARYKPAIETYGRKVVAYRWTWMVWRPTPMWASTTSLVAIWTLFGLSRISEFIYFRF